MKRKLIILVACFLGSIGLIGGLAVLSDHLVRKPGSFLRQLPPHPALEGKVVTLKYNSYYIAGATEHHIYLGNYTAPLHVLIVDVENADTTSTDLQADKISNWKFWALRLKVDSPKFYLMDGAVPIIFQGNVTDWMAKPIPCLPAYFQDFEPITSQSFAIRALGKPVRENILGIISLARGIEMKTGILKKQVDGVFCTEGSFHYDRARNELVYVYLYRNEFIALDTSMHILRTGHTIDTVTRADIKVETIRSTGETKFAVPQYINNPGSFPAGNLLFVNSRLIAKNENPKATGHATAIDVYQLHDGKYKFSFYIYDFLKKERMKGFQVHGDKFFALFDYHLQIWHLQPGYFPKRDLE